MEYNKNVDIWNEAIKIPVEVYEKEKNLHNTCLNQFKNDFIINENKVLSVYECWENQPHRFFFFELDGNQYCGQKLISPIVTEYGSPGLFCSLIKPEMLLGKVIRSQTSQQGVEIYYRQISNKQRVSLFNELKSNRQIDIFYPFVQLSKDTRLEINTPDEGWFITSERAKLLAIGEKHFRKISIELIKGDNKMKPIIYDPACSTGRFLEEIKTEIPHATVIGQDISKQMCEWAAPKLDQVILGNSLNPGMPNKSCDYIFFRFLNAEVVTTQMAKKLFEKIILCLKESGKAILFGHTPVLISAAFIEQRGFIIQCCNEYSPEEDAVFQYYIIEHNKKTP